MMKRQTYGQGPERSGACGTHTLCPCPPHEGLRLSGQISISGPSTSHLGMHSLSLLTFWSVTLVRVLLTQGGNCCGGGDFLLLVVCVLITKYLLHSLSGFFLPALPSTFFFFTLKRKLIQAFQAASCSHSQKPPTPAVTSSVPEPLCLIPAGSIIPPHLTVTLYP